MLADLVVVLRGGLVEAIHIRDKVGGHGISPEMVAVVDIEEDAEDPIVASRHTLKPMGELDPEVQVAVERVPVTNVTSKCPNCGADDPDFREVSIEGQCAIQEGSCDECGASFRHVYEMAEAMILEVTPPTK